MKTKNQKQKIERMKTKTEKESKFEANFLTLKNKC